MYRRKRNVKKALKLSSANLKRRNLTNDDMFEMFCLFFKIKQSLRMNNLYTGEIQ